MDAMLAAGACTPQNPVNEEEPTQSVKHKRFSSFPFSKLPDEVLGKYLLPYMSLQDICACARVNGRFRDIIDANLLNAVCFCRNFCSPHITEKAREKYQTVTRRWLHQFGPGGREHIVKLDQKTAHTRFPELLFYSIAKTLVRAEELAVSPAGSFTEKAIVRDVSFSPDGIHAMASFLGSGARLYRLVDGKWQSGLLISPDSMVDKLRFSADSSKVITAASDRWIRLHKLVGNNWQEQACLRRADGLHVAALSGQCQMALAGIKRVIIYGYDGAQWQQEYDESDLDQALVPKVRFSPDGKHFVLACKNLSMYALVDGKWRLQETVPDSCIEPVFRFSPDGNRLLSVFRERKVKIHHLVAGEWQESNTFPLRSNIMGCRFSPDGRQVMLYLETNSITFLSFVNGVWQISGTMNHSNSLSVFKFSPNGMYAMTGCYDNTVKFFQQAGGQWQQKMQIKINEGLSHVTFSPCGTHIAVTNDENIATIYGLRNGQCYMKGHIPGVKYGRGVRFSPIGGYLSANSAKKLNFFTLISDCLSASDDIEPRLT